MPTDDVQVSIATIQDVWGKREQFLSQLLDLSPVGLFIYDRDGTYLLVNRAWEAFLGKSRDEILGKRLRDLLAPETAADLEASAARVVETGEPCSAELTADFPQGTRQYYLTVFPLMDGNGQVNGIGGIAIDITDRKMAEQAQAGQARLLAQIADTSPNIVYIFDFDENSTVYVNRAMERLVGLTTEAVKALGPDFMRQYCHPDDLPYFSAHVEKLLRLGDSESLTFEYRIKAVDGTWHWHLSIDTIFKRHPDGSPAQMLSSAVDITEQKRIESKNVNLIVRANSRILELNSLLDILPAGVFIGTWDRMLSVNAQGLALLGFDSLDELQALNKTARQHFQVLDPETMQPSPPEDNSFVRALQGQTASRKVVYRNLKTGKDTLVHATSAPIIENEEVVAAVGIATDITEIEHLQEGLRRSNDLLNRLLSSTSDAVYMKNKDGTYVLINAANAVLLGITPEEAVGKRDTDFFPPEIAAMVAANDARVMEENTTVLLEETVPTAEGIRTFLSSKDAVRDANGTVVGLVGISRDITEFRRVTAELELREAQFRTLAENLPDFTWLCNADGKMTYISPQWTVYTGLTLAEVATGREQEVIHEADFPAVIGAWREALQTGKGFSIDFRCRRASDGMYRWFECRVTPIVNAEGKVTQWVGSSVDIDERKQARLEIEDLNRRLANAMQETHHRVKNNLQIINAVAETILDDYKDTIPRSAMQRIAQHARTLSAIHDLLTLRLRQTDEAETLSARSILDRLIPMLQSTSGGRPIRYETDDTLLSQKQSSALAMLVSELISNAIKHGTGLIEVTLLAVAAPDAVSLAAPQTHLRLEVCDDGEGFPADFDPKTAANTGLSLIETLVVWDLRGTVAFTNRPEGGARGVVVFPINLV